MSTIPPHLILKQIHLFVDGHVQGVGFRYFVYEYAAQNGLTGWVRNRYNGQVEIAAEGSEEKLTNMLEHVRRGPGRSMVTDIKVEWFTAEGKYTIFSMLATE